MWDVVLDALLDTLKLLPFLFLLYLLIEVLEHKTELGKPSRALNGKFAPVIGSATGLIPLCGFSVMAAKLYERRHLTLGTLLAVFLATSDEAFLVLLLSGMEWSAKAVSILIICAVKLVLGISVGYLADAVLRKRTPVQALPAADFSTEHVHNEHEHDDHEHEHGEYSVCEHRHENRLNLYLWSPLLHSLKVAVFILLINFLFGALFFAAGEERVIAFLQAGYWVQPLIASLIGLIPNCASSVVVAETYAMGGISLGSCIAGLLVNTGLGTVVLLKNGKAWKRNLLIIGFLFAAGLVTGYLVNAVQLAVL